MWKQKKINNFVSRHGLRGGLVGVVQRGHQTGPQRGLVVKLRSRLDSSQY